MGERTASLQQAQPRLAKRMTCAVSFGAQRFTGVVLNVSQGGLFVQTAAAPERGESVDLELNPPGDESTIPLRAEVVWRRVVPSQLRSTGHGGMGVKIMRADENYYSALAEWMRVSPERVARGASDATRDPNLTPYRVRVRAKGTPRTRSVSVDAASDDGARDAAIDYLGEGWQIIAVERI